MKKSGARRVRSTRYLNPELSGIVRTQYLKLVSRQSLPFALATPVPTTTITIASGTLGSLANIIPSLKNPIRGISNEYSVNNFNTLSTWYEEYRLLGMKVKARVEIINETDTGNNNSFGNLYLMVKRLGAANPTRWEEVAAHKYRRIKKWETGGGGGINRSFWISLYMTPQKWLQRKYDPSLDDIPWAADETSGDLTTDNSFEFGLFLDNNGVKDADCRVYLEIFFWIKTSRPLQYDVTS